MASMDRIDRSIFVMLILFTYIFYHLIREKASELRRLGLIGPRVCDIVTCERILESWVAPAPVLRAVYQEEITPLSGMRVFR